MAEDIEIPPSGLVHTDLAAQVAGVKPGTIRQWKNRGHLAPATDTDGAVLKDDTGRILFEVLDVIDAEYKLRPRARRSAVSYA
ncbi:hypothetical protein ACFQ07_09935 [Actinomadura adrarensis]|uniref:MerR family transcriptional regulator n=1 Tax=Actinomadura adrarensis TaxID=1819600 RepID=A0ABW3CG29_9ACTN